MKILCDCNADWEDEYTWLGNHYKYFDATKICRLVLDVRDDSIDYCYECDSTQWYDADYENMMFDLKEMNR